MSKKSRKRNKILGAMLLGLGASKLGMLSGKTAGINVDKGRGSVLGEKYRTPKKFLPNAGPSKSTTSKKILFPRKSVDEIGNVKMDGVDQGIGNKKSLFINRKSDSKFPTGIYQGGKKIKDLNPKAINVLSDGKISSGGKTFENKKAYSDAMKLKRANKRSTAMKKVSDGPSLFGFRFKDSLFKKGTMVKARGGGMARMKPTKLY